MALFLSGVLLSLAYPEPNLSFVAGIALVPLLAALRDTSARRGALCGALFGAGFFGSLLVWVSLVGWVAWVVLVVFQTAFLAAFGALTAMALRGRGSWARLLLPAAIWVIVEVARAEFPVVGFPWGELAQGQTGWGGSLALAPLGGRHLVAAAVVTLNAAVLALGERGPDFRRAAVTIAALLLLPVALPDVRAGGPTLSVAIVQGNVPREWSGTFFEKDLAILRSHVELTRSIEGVDLVVWPESAVGIDHTRVPEVGEALSSAARTAGAPLIAGGNLDRDDGRYEVDAFLVSEDGAVVDRYQKTHLVPFGEYVPQRNFFDVIPMLDQVPRDAVPGTEKTLFTVAGGTVAPVISFEGDFGSLVRRRIDAGGRLLVVATNTSTWGDSWASAQHVAMSQVRAAENGVWTIHAALSGISAVVDPTGEIVAQTPLFTPATLSTDVAFATRTTPYTRAGGWVVVIAVVAVAGALLQGRRSRPRRVAAEQDASRNEEGGTEMAYEGPDDRRQALVIVPTYNERESIGEAARRLFAAAGDTVDLLVVDDGSPDGTADLVRALAEGPHGVHLLERTGKLGLGTAYITGFRWAMERGYEIVVEMDADLSHDPADVPRLIAALDGADLAIGSRYVPGGGVENWGAVRRALSGAGNVYARAWLGFGVKDSTSGFRAYKTAFLRTLDLDTIRSEGYAFQIEMTRRVFRAGGRIVEVPITFVERVAGRSKMSRSIVGEALRSVTRWGIADRFTSRRSRQAAQPQRPPAR